MKNDMILILNYSDEFSQEAAKRLRAEHIYCRIINGMTTAGQIREIAPRGVILAGEAKSAAGVFDAEILSLGIPLLAMGHAAHMLLAAQGGASAGVALENRKATVEYGASALFMGLKDAERYMPEAQTLMLPPDVRMTASAAGCTIAFEDSERRRYGVQFELERNDPDGTAILTNFSRHICGCNAWWTIEAAIHEAKTALESAAASGGRALCAVSGGVDSAVAAVLARQAYGDAMSAVFVNTGLLRDGECGQVIALYEQLNVPLIYVDMSESMLSALDGIDDMRQKSAAVMDRLRGEVIRQARLTGADTLILGSHYSDYLQSGDDSGMWQGSDLTIVRPLRMLFKREVCDVAGELGLSVDLINRKPFPALGLGARVLGEVTAGRLAAIRMAESIFREEIREAGLDRRLYKYFPVLAGGNGDNPGETILLRAVNQSSNMLMPARLPYDVIERTVERILREAPAVSRVFFDYTPTQVGHESFL